MGNCSVSALSTKETLCAGTLVGLTLAAAVSAIVLHRLSLFDKGVTGNLKGWHIVVGGSSLIVLADIYGLNKLYKKEPSKAAPAAQIVEVKTAILLGEEDSKVAEEELAVPREIVYLTGTNSTTLFGMERIAAVIPEHLPALVPTGTLLTHNIVPLAGELDPQGGIAEGIGVNHKGISTVTVFQHSKAKYYATQKDFIVNIEREIRYLKDFTIESNITRTKIAILRLWHLKERCKNIQEIRKYITDIIKLLQSQPKKAKIIQEAFAHFQAKPPEGIQAFLDADPYPIVWGIVDQGDDVRKSVCYMESFGEIKGETTINKTLVLGKDVAIAYTTQEKTHELQTWLSAHNCKGVKVYPLSELALLEQQTGDNLSVIKAEFDSYANCR